MDPVAAADGHVYDRFAIEEWFWRQDDLRSPMTNLPLESSSLTANVPLRKAIEDYRQQRSLVELRELERSALEDDLRLMGNSLAAQTARAALLEDRLEAVRTASNGLRRFLLRKGPLADDEGARCLEEIEDALGSGEASVSALPTLLARTPSCSSSSCSSPLSNMEIAALVEQLQKGTREEKETAATALAKAAENPIAAGFIERAGGLAPLICLFTHGDADISETAATALAYVVNAERSDRTLIALEEGIGALVHLLSHLNESIRTEAARGLSEVTYWTCQRGSCAVLYKGGVGPLVRLLSSTSADSQKYAALALANMTDPDISSVFAATIDEIVKAEGVERLLRLTSSFSVVVQGPVAQCLANVLDQSNEAMEYVTEDQGYRPLLTLLCQDINLKASSEIRCATFQAKAHAARALACIMREDTEVSVDIVSQGGIKPLFLLFGTEEGDDVESDVWDDSEWLEASMEAFADLIDWNETARDSVVSQGYLPTLMSLLSCCSPEVCEPVARALAVMAWDNEAVAAMMARSSSVVSVINALHCPWDSVQKWSARILMDIARTEGASCISQNGGISGLITVLADGWGEAQLWALGALWYLAEDEDDSKAIVREGGIPHLTNLAESGCPRTKQWAVGVLEELENKPSVREFLRPLARRTGMASVSPLG